MFCRKCGNEIPDDSVFCLKCGTKIEIIENKVQESGGEKEEPVVVEEEPIVVNDDNSINTESTDTTASTSDKKNMYGIFGALAVLFLIVIIAVSVSENAENAKKCTLSSCDEYKTEGSDYCREHTCTEDGCTLSKSKYEKYCYQHEKEHVCSSDGCDNYKMTGSEYCYSHTCDEEGCFEKVAYNNNYCSTHKKDMRKLLDLKYFMIDKINSAGGIEMKFSATNKSTKEIKYVKFYVQLFNAVGDKIKDEITDKHEVYVEIVGPAEYNQSIEFEKIIGYNDTCDRIEIDDITIVYMDGTTYSGWYGYYYER